MTRTSIDRQPKLVYRFNRRMTLAINSDALAVIFMVSFAWCLIVPALIFMALAAIYCRESMARRYMSEKGYQRWRYANGLSSSYVPHRCSGHPIVWR